MDWVRVENRSKVFQPCVSLASADIISPAPAGMISPASAGMISPAPAGMISPAPVGMINPATVSCILSLTLKLMPFIGGAYGPISAKIMAQGECAFPSIVAGLAQYIAIQPAGHHHLNQPDIAIQPARHHRMEAVGYVGHDGTW